MRVLLDARKLGHGGIGVYIDNLVHGLAAHGDVDLTLIVREAFDPEEYSWGKGVALISDRARPYSIDEMFGLARRIDFAGIDVFHSPHFTLPFGIRVPSVVTVHDLIHVHNPQRAFYPVVARGLVRSSLKRASAVVTVSRASCKELAALAPFASDKISVVPNSLGAHFEHSFGREAVDPELLELQRRPYVLGVFSNTKPHKRLHDLVEAFAAVKARAEFESLTLVLAGMGFEAGSHEWVQEQYWLRGKGYGHLLNDINVLGMVSKTQLVSLYRQARVLAVPSIAEGFCLPALEARALGTAVVARSVPAVRELLGEGDYVADGNNIAAFERALLRALRDRLDHENHAEICPEVVSKYSIERAAGETFGVYQQAMILG